MLYEESVPPTMTMVLAMGPKLLVKSAVERNLTAKAREDYTSGEVGQLCAAAVHVIKRSGVEHEEASDALGRLHICRPVGRKTWCATSHVVCASSVSHKLLFDLTLYGRFVFALMYVACF